MKIKIDSKIKSDMKFQEYKPQPSIDGVFMHSLDKKRAREGSFMEYIRITDNKVERLPIDFEPKQISVSWAIPNRINAFHIHPKEQQDEFWCVIQGEMLIWLVDIREDSPTLGNRRSYLLSSESPAILLIPAGVAHGYKSGINGATLLYSMNAQFNRSDPNEGRLAWDYFGSDLWEENRG